MARECLHFFDVASRDSLVAVVLNDSMNGTARGIAP
jgi:hypothetical protein